ncbi:MAG: PTS sugar transporter subunit IIC [Selenomonadaceae bacterium]|nr:PTS sugar transporter subunit IIC [Selenomonadaceae bacterium]
MSKQEMFDKFIEAMARFADLKVVGALRDGFIMTTPFTICGSVFLLLANLPIPGYGDMMAGMFGPQWTVPLYAISGATFDVLGLICAVTIPYKYVEAQECDAITAATLSLCVFLAVVPATTLAPNGDVVAGVIPKMWAGSNGIITAIIVGLITGITCVYCQVNHLGIKMPPSVPGGVVRAFEALTPGMILFTGAAIVYGVCYFGLETSFPQLIFTMIQTPLQGLSDTLIGGSVFVFLMSLLFWAGVHGPNVVGGVMNPLMLANALENQQILESTGRLVYGDPGVHVFTIQVMDVFVKLCGCGSTGGLLIASYLVAKSDQMKSITKLATVPGLFNINEPVIFGLPIVFNPFMIAPFILAPLCITLIVYFSIASGFMNPFTAVQIPWTTPVILSGLLLNGWQGAVVQIVSLATATAIYFPFVKAQDNAYVKEQEEEAAAEES